MPVLVTNRSQNHILPIKNCVFCKRPTGFWTKISRRSEKEQVACCQTCAASKDEEEVLSFSEWTKREESRKRL